MEDIPEDELYDKEENMATQTPIQNRYAFWYHRRGGGKVATPTSNYEESMKLLASFQTVEHFWRIYDHMIRPNEFKTTTDYHLFKDGIKPTWEDPQNKGGGKWMVRLKKGLASHLWEDLVLAIIGEQFDVGHEICGAVVSVRNTEDIISIWNKTAENVEATNKIRDQMRRILRLPTFVAVEYKKHQDSLVDKSSFRNPSLVWRAGSGGGNRGHSGPDRGERGERGERPDRGDRERHHSAPQGAGGDQKPNQGNYDNTKERYSPRTSYHRDRGEGDTPHGFPRPAWKPTREGASSGVPPSPVRPESTGGGWSTRRESGETPTGGGSGWGSGKRPEGSSGYWKSPREHSSGEGATGGGSVNPPASGSARGKKDGSTPTAGPPNAWGKREEGGAPTPTNTRSGSGGADWANKGRGSSGESGGAGATSTSTPTPAAAAGESGGGNAWTRRKPPNIDTNTN